MFLDRSAARTVLLSLVGVAVSASAWADTPTVPLQLQVELCSKVIEYVQEPAVMSLDRIRIGIVVKPGSPESLRAGAELKAAFDRAGHRQRPCPRAVDYRMVERKGAGG